MRKPVIGISGSIIFDGSGNFAGYRRSYVNEDYVQSVIKNGGIPYIIPMNADDEVIKQQIENIDALILSGGQDVNPLLYNEQPHRGLGGILPERDYFDYKLIDFAKQKNIPILGICRGFQILNVYHGGTLYQDLSAYKESFIKHDQVNNPSVATHTVDIVKGTKLHAMFNEDVVMVNSFHHQIIKDVPKGFKVSAIASDKVIEAIEAEGDTFIVAVQWHPEMLHRTEEKMNLLFKTLIDHAQ